MNEAIAIIDDSLTVRMNLDEACREAGFETCLFKSLEEACAAFSQALPALVILDVVLPDGDGIEFLVELRMSLRTQKIPVILLSSEAEVEDRIRGLRVGANEYVGKPYDTSYVVARARDLLRSSRPNEDGLTRLLIDDSLTYREELSESLRHAGYKTVLAKSGEQGLQLAADVRPGAVIVDGVMPGIDGTSVIHKIRLDPGLQTTPCLFLTASEAAASEVQALDSGADAYLRKDAGTEVILARLGAMLRATEQSRDRAHAATAMGAQRILAVDDSRTYLEEIAEQLRQDGYEVIKANSGEEALALLKVDHIDCVLLDLLMPGLSGTQTCHQVKSSPATSTTPVIMLTSLDNPEAIVEGMNAGADDYVAKTVDFEVIKARLRAQLRRKQIESENRRVREEVLKKDAEARAARRQASEREELLRQLEVKNRELENVNQELQSFAYSVSHDLRQPLRGMDGFSQVLLEEYSSVLDEKGKHYLQRVRAGAQRMGDLIEGLLLLSRVTRKELRKSPIRIDKMAQKVLRRLQDAEPERLVESDIDEPMEGRGDFQLVESILENLLGNAWKFTSKRPLTRIKVGVCRSSDECSYYIKDNGAGFKMEYADKLFAPFQRLHTEKEYPGTGIGLATTQRIVHRHGGRIWAESQLNLGTTFYFTLSPTPVKD
ncbi:MAG: response regulator [Myxococcota bacterium]